MSPKINNIAQNEAAVKYLPYIKLAVSVLFFLLGIILSVGSVIKFILFLISAAAVGYQIVLDAVEDIMQGNYFSDNLLLLLVTVIAFAIGYSIDATAALIILYGARFLIEYVENKSIESAYEFIQYQDEETQSAIRAVVENKKNRELELKDTINASCSLILKIAMAFAVLYAIFLPIITNYSYTASIHRAIIILIISTPTSLTAAAGICGVFTICYAGQLGMIAKNAHAIEKLEDVSTAVIDKFGIFNSEPPRIVSIESNVFDQKTFMNFVAHAVYYSSQQFAQAILDYDPSREYNLEVISDFKDIPGYGVELKVNNMDVLFGTHDLFKNRGLSIEPVSAADATTYYMTVSGRFVGTVAVSDDYNSENLTLVQTLKEHGIKKCILLTEDGREHSQKVSDELGFDAYFSECNIEKKKSIINDITVKANHSVIFIYSNGIEEHSAADVDFRINRRGKYADILVLPDFLLDIASGFRVSQRSRFIMLENALFAFIVKAIIIFLAINGLATLWFAVFMDMVVIMAAMLNCVRIAGDSLFASITRK